MITRALAARTGRRADDLRIRVLAAAVIGVMMSAFLPENLEADIGAMRDSRLGPEFVQRVDEALALLEEGLPL